jgi:Cof subfamily protein (haloacid dehalogenase superfamily)
MTHSKIALVDVDGTLVDYEGNLPASAVDAIRLARANGHRVYACTGRSKAEMYQEIWDIGLDGMIGGNGCYIEDSNEVVFHQLIPADEERRLVDWLSERNIAFYLESNSGLFGNDSFRTDSLDAIRAYSAGKGMPENSWRKVGVEDVFPDMIFGGELYRDDVNKVSFVLRSYQDHLDSAAAFPDLKAGTWGGKGESALFGDLGVQGISKAFAVDKLCEYLGASVKDTIAFGDAKVDIPMFEACGASCCMGSGGDEAKAAADFVTSDVDKDGLSIGFRHFGLI